MSAEALAGALAALGVRAGVEARDGFALISAAPDAFADEALRAKVVALAAEHGFRSVALEVGEPEGDSAPGDAALHRR
ncbi:MAG TPA: hypothetical protein VFS05_01955 [Gemmatimonadaceae bacterium]|nr:hypothetical protein [Gemmatimonadaceae bacterium]